MNTTTPPDPKSSAGSGRRFSWLWILAAAWLAIVLVALLFPRQHLTPTATASADRKLGTASRSENEQHSSRAHHLSVAPGSTQTAEEIVAHKLTQFARNRRQLAHDLARHHNVAVPDEVERFFNAAEDGRFDETQTLFNSLKAKRNTEAGADLMPYWRAIVEAEGAAEQVHAWPAQKLLDYGNSVLDSLRPGMVYVGGDDPGCFIPTMLNETSDGEHHVVLTQNALADSTYLDYLRFLYGGRLQVPTQEDSQSAFQKYLEDAQKRLAHDQQFPDEPKQVRPGEDITLTDGRVQVSGRVAVMAINELLMQNILQKNPDLSFALEESYPLKSTYSDATTLGPVMELRAPDGQSALTADSAAQSVAYWQTTAQQLLSDPATPDGSDARKSYGHLAEAQANLLASHNFNDQAEQAYRTASTLWPDSVELLSDFSGFLAGAGRLDEANRLIDNFVQSYPTNRAAVEKLRQTLPSKPRY